MGHSRGISAALVLCLLPLCALPQSFVPKELEGWRSWVLHDKPFLRCPFFANTDGAQENDRVCALPGRLTLDLTQSGGRFSQSWLTYSQSWIALPGNLDNWPAAVTINGNPAAVVARDGVPQLYAAAGTFTIAGQFQWTRRPESLAVPDQDGLIALTVDGHPSVQVDRDAAAIWLGKHRDAEVAQQLDVQVYRQLTDGIPLELDTRMILRVTGEAREEVLPAVLPHGFEPTALHTPLPARLGADGNLRLQVRAGNWTVELNARAAESLASVSLAPARGSWPQQEIWSYRGNDRLRVAVVEGVDGVDPAQANVPQEWRSLPSYRMTAGGSLQIVEHSRGASAQDNGHLTLNREMFLDFSHGGFTVVDHISGQMRSGWRLDMKQPFALAHAAVGADDLLVTRGADSQLTGVEIRTPNVGLSTVARLADVAGSLPATGWEQRFDQVNATLTLPPGHRLLAALGADQAPGAWIERWTLLDLFLLFLTTAAALRLLGRAYGALAGLAIVLIYQENAVLVGLLLVACLAVIVLRRVPDGRFKTPARWLQYAALALLTLQTVAYAATQIRCAFYPQLADSRWPQGFAAEQPAVSAPPPTASPPMMMDAPRTAVASAPPMAMAEAVAKTRQSRELVVDAPYARAAMTAERYAPGTLVQAGPGIPQWRYVRYDYGWSGPVDAAQTVRFVIVSPLMLGVWRMVSVILLVTLLWRMTHADTGIRTMGRRLFGAGAYVVPAAVALLLGSTLAATSRAAETPDRTLLAEMEHVLSRPSACVPNCAEIMDARVTLDATKLEVSLEVAALADIAVPLPSLGERTDPGAISIDGTAVAGVYRDANQQLWLALEHGAHTVKISGRLAPVDAVAMLFAQVPRRITVTAQGWDVAGTAGSKLLGNTLQLTRHASALPEGMSAQGADRFAPYVRVQRNFALALDWSIKTRVERIAPEHGGFTLEIPLLAGESVLTSGIDTHGDTRVPASFDSDAADFQWDSAFEHVDHFELRAPENTPWSEVWTFRLSPMWRVAFDGTPAVLPENGRPDSWTFEYYPRAGEVLKVSVSRPAAIAGNTLAIDSVTQQVRVGERSSEVELDFAYRSTQGNPHAIDLPPGARLTDVSVDDQVIPLRLEHGQLPLALLPGAHHVKVRWQSDDKAGVLTRAPHVDLQVASSNVTTTLQAGRRWVLFAGGRGIGPAILYWGELSVFAVLAVALGRSRHRPIRTHECLLLGLGLSTFSWSVTLLVFLWMAALRWREGLRIETLGQKQFRLVHIGLGLLTCVAVLSLLMAIPHGLLASPDMRISGAGQVAGGLSWFNDRSGNQLPDAWVLSVSMWWYRAAMLAWALWLAAALMRWLPSAWRALTAPGLTDRTSALW